MPKKIFAYKKNLKITKKTLREIEKEGFIPVPVEFLDDVKILEMFPEVDETWLLSTAMDLILADYTMKQKFGDKIMNYLKNRVNSKLPKLED